MNRTTLFVSTGVAAALALLPAVAAGARIAKGPWIQHVTPTSAVLRVEVDPPAPVTFQLGFARPGEDREAGSGIVESRERRAIHAILMNNLEPATRYTFSFSANGEQRYGAVTTAPLEDSGTPFRFLVYGDNRSDDVAHAAVVRAMVSVPSDLLINTGDLVEHGGAPAHWQTFFDIEAPLMRERPFFAAVGNHELVEGAGAEYVRYFGPSDPPAPLAAGMTMPVAAGSSSGPNAREVLAVPLADAGPTPFALEQLSGTFRWSNARFFLINGMVAYQSGASRAWLEKVLGASDHEPGLVWRIVVVHHGPWSSGPHGGNALLHDANVPDLFAVHGVDLVIAGHDHLYERGVAAGLPYLVSGGGGAPTYTVKSAGPTSRRHESERHFIEASVSAVGIEFTAVRPDSSVIERCALRKGAGWDCDAPTSAASSTPAPADRPPSRCGCRVPGQAPKPGMGALAFFLSVAAGLFARRRAAVSVRG